MYLSKYKYRYFCKDYLGRVVDLTTGVSPSANKVRDLLIFTTLNITLWFFCVFSTVKWNQNLQLNWSELVDRIRLKKLFFGTLVHKFRINIHYLHLGFAVSGLMKRSYSWFVIKSTRPKFIVSKPPSKQIWPFLAFPVCPGGRMTSLCMLLRIPSFSESESAIFS